MSFPALEQYLARLQHAAPTSLKTRAAGSSSLSGSQNESSTDAVNTAHDESRVWLDADGRAQGRYFNTTLTSVFQPIRQIAVAEDVGFVAVETIDAVDTVTAKRGNQIVGYEGFAHSYSANDNGLYLWKLLDHAASDDESIELDRLCRMLHSINFYRQLAAPSIEGNADLYLSVHARLLAAVDSNHGMAFRRILKLLELPHEHIVLQLPSITATQSWLLNYVLDNYRRNHFRLAINANSVAEAHSLLERVRPEVLKIDSRGLTDDAETRRLLDIAHQRDIRVIFKRLEKSRDCENVQKLAQQIFAENGTRIFAQGFFWDLPQASLDTFSSSSLPFIPAWDAVPSVAATDGGDR
ncbi:EAL domain-containing protein [Glaciimonas sp. PCH181]|uniref:EAL domain-containing protein n=1 Tax=Glaciimonas sp. PCH181 TaxID=2133943 RepID=UPI000D368C7F|nr:EAL domain-containing protein [Glaciimonas sp. PCH181]PUA16531.1 diguanylate phosphodiesterase [Glaciimonas sp. PCH181]